MPASRSRTEQWRRSLEQIQERNGSIEIALARHVRREAGSVISTPVKSLLWRARVLELTADSIIVEHPTTMGRPAPIQPGARIIAVMSVGQNQWMFHTSHEGSLLHRLNATKTVPAIRLAAPTNVERCQRRAFYRVSTVGLLLPEVRCAPLLDVRSAIPAEESCRARVQRMLQEQILGAIGAIGEDGEPSADFPEPGGLAPDLDEPMDAILVNIGGGGVGLLFEPDSPIARERKPLYWLELDLTPMTPAPVGVVGRLVHTRINSAQRINAGFAFVFDHNPRYEDFIVDQLCRCVVHVERDQLRRSGDAG